MLSQLTTRWIFRSALAVALGIGTAAMAALPYEWTGMAGDQNYDNEQNWTDGSQVIGPPWGSFNEIGYIGGNATVRVTNMPEPFGQLLLGQDAGDNVTFIIENGGNLALYRGSNENDFGGGIDVGLNGSATLRINPGGTLDSGYIIVRGSGNSAIIDGSGPGTTSVHLMNIPGRNSGFNVAAGNSMRIIGPNADITSHSFDLDPGATYVAEITAPTHSTFKTPAAAGADGILKVEFTGYTPSVGDSWTLIDAPSFVSTFSEIQVPDLGLPLGQGFFFKTGPDAGSTYGQTGKLVLEQQLVLKVNRDTREMSIATGQLPVAIDGYSITSGLGGLNPANWDSLDSKNVGDWRESPQNGTPNAISELKPTGATSVTTAAPIILGDVFRLPTATSLGQELEDIQFQYYMPDGTVVDAQVVYEGAKHHNDLVLVVDPLDGGAYIQHQSTISVAVDGYNIHSESGSLLSGNSNWTSLEDQGINTWAEASPTSNDLTELLPEGVSLMAQGVTFDLGTPFRTVGSGGSEDLVFSYLPEGAVDFVEGTVVYMEFELTELFGDYNSNGVVDASDYVVWRNTLGTNVPAGTGADGNNDGMISILDYTVWKNNFGKTIVGGAALNVSPTAVPEPTTCLGLGLLALGGLVGRRFRRGSL